MITREHLRRIFREFDYDYTTFAKDLKNADEKLANDRRTVSRKLNGANSSEGFLFVCGVNSPEIENEPARKNREAC
jgi:hypothetical protein